MKDLANAYAEWLRQRERLALLRHAGFYFLLNALFALLNLSTSPERIWFHYALLGWGLGLFMHFVSVFFLTDYRMAAEKFASFVNGRPLYEGFVEFHKRVNLRSVIAHAVIYVLANVILAALNLSFTPQKLWFIYPLLGWGLGLLFHFLYGYTLYDWEGLWATFILKAKGG